MAESKKVTIMVLKVDLQCQKCYKKVKKVLSKFPEIRDQTYDEKQNQVTIKVVCCSPEKIRDKLCCKGGDVIKSIEIKPPENKKKDSDKTTDKSKSDTKPASSEKDKVPVGSIPGYQSVPLNTCCSDCYHGHPGGPCYSGYGARGPAPYIQYDGYYGRPVYDNYGSGVPGNCVTSSQCFREENPQVCTIM